MHSSDYHPLLNRQMAHVLVVDPDGESAGRLAAALDRRQGIVVVPSARAALSAMEPQLPDLVVTELDLPDANGLELLTRLHQTAATRHVLLMVVTRRAAVRDKVAAFQAGADDYLVKPVGMQDFAKHVARLLQLRRILQR